MLKRKLMIVFVSIFCVMVLSSSALAADPGSAADPLVTKSYVDDKVKQITDIINLAQNGGSSNTDAIVNQVMDKLQLILDSQNSGGANTPSSGTTYTPVFAAAGKVLFGEEGTEIILRSGTATGFIMSENGIVNVTTGQEILHGTPLTVNNLLIVPRGDGRGAYATSDCWFLVKGGYKFE